MLFIYGMITGAALLGLMFWLQSNKIIVKWYEWLLGALGFVMLIWTINDYFGSIAEHNETAAGVFLWLLGAPAIILLGLAIFLPWWRNSRKADEAKK